MHIDAVQIGMNVIYVPPQAKGDRQHKDCERGVVKSKNEKMVFVLFEGDCQTKGCHPENLK